MWLYILVLQELLISIKNNSNINGYRLNILDNYETKSRAYADDIGATLIDDNSIKEFFKEFEKWGKYSGGEINKDKTKILSINGTIEKDLEHLSCDELKILGVKFNKNGISDSNVKEIFNKIDISIQLWSLKEFDMLQRVTALKTFILSKLWFIMNFIVLNRNDIIILERKIFQYLWSNNHELIKRETLIRSKNEGGIDMIDINSRISSIRIKQFLSILNNYNRIEYQYGLKWLKFKMRNFVSNINIIPYESPQNNYYENIIIIINQNRSIMDEIINKNIFMNLKSIYNMIKKKNEIKPKIEDNCLLNEIVWKTVYKKIFYKKLQSKFKAFNYKLLFKAISVKEKFYRSSHCSLCCRQIQDIYDHLYFNCPKLLIYGETMLEENTCKRLNKDNFLFFVDVNENEIYSFSVLKYEIFNLYMRASNSNVSPNDIIRIFKSFERNLRHIF